MPEDGVPLQAESSMLSADEIVRLATLFAREGVRKIRLTGGEPTVRRDCIDIVGRLASIDGISTVAMTTNGLMLPRMLPGLVNAGLTAVNVSLDTLQDFKFEIITRRKGFDRVLNGIEKATEAGLEVSAV